MRGKIINYDTQTGTGIISGDDNVRYNFKGTEFKSELHLLKSGTTVDFSTEDQTALSIFRIGPPVSSLDSAATQLLGSEKSKVAAALLSFFLGSLGIHKFYLGYNKAGVIMLLVTLLGAILILPPLIMGVIAFVEAILYLTKTDEQFQETYVINEKQWF